MHNNAQSEKSEVMTPAVIDPLQFNINSDNDVNQKPIYENYIDRLFDDPKCQDAKEDHVIDNLYLSDCYSSINYDKYKLIINCDYPYNNTRLNEKRFDIVDAISSETNKEVTFHILGIGIDDHINQNLSDSFDEVTELMRKYTTKNSKVLIHCRMGISRSASFVIAYLINYHNMTLLYALDYLKKKRPIIKPNDGFLQQLKRYEEKRYKLY